MKSLFKTIPTESDFSSCYIPVCNGYLAITNTSSSQLPSWEGKQGGCGRTADISGMDAARGSAGWVDLAPAQHRGAHVPVPAGT